jgi:hypothetical protein
MHRGPRGEKRPADVVGAAVMALGVFMTERDGPMTPKAFHALFRRIGARAKMPFRVHPHGDGHCRRHAKEEPRLARGSNLMK